MQPRPDPSMVPRSLLRSVCSTCHTWQDGSGGQTQSSVLPFPSGLSPQRQVSSSSSGMLGIFGEIRGGKRGKSQRSCKRAISTPLSHPTGCLHSVTCLVPVRGWFVTLLKVKNHLLKDEKSAGLEVTRFWPKLLRLESCTEEADCFQPERV